MRPGLDGFASSSVTQFAELRGRKVGGFGNTFLDWLVLRAAGKKARGLDVETDASTVIAAPPLLNQLLMRGEIDAAIQFSSLAMAPLTTGEARAISDLAVLLRQAQFNAEAFYTQWFITEQWLGRNAAALDRLYAMFAAAYDRLEGRCGVDRTCTAHPRHGPEARGCIS